MAIPKIVAETKKRMLIYDLEEAKKMVVSELDERRTGKYRTNGTAEAFEYALWLLKRADASELINEYMAEAI